jgi:hypothetical protein
VAVCGGGAIAHRDQVIQRNGRIMSQTALEGTGGEAGPKMAIIIRICAVGRAVARQFRNLDRLAYGGIWLQLRFNCGIPHSFQ